ncbi:MAG: SirB2 family protein [Bacteroidia bacterium]
MYTGILHTHTLVVSLFLLIYLIKTVLLFLGKTEMLQNFTRKFRVPEMIISVLFFATGIYLAVNTGNGGTWLWVKLAAVLISIPLAVIGFKRMNKNLALLSLILLIYSYGISETKSPFFKKENKAVETVDGKEIYEAKCISCHGIDGKLGMSGSKDISLSQLKPEEKIKLITNGKNAMKGYKEVLTAEQINAVAEYTETLKK